MVLFIISLRQLLPAPNTFEPASNTISKNSKIPFILKINAFWKSRSGRDYCVPDIKILKKNQNSILDKKKS